MKNRKTIILFILFLSVYLVSFDCEDQKNNSEPVSPSLKVYPNPAKEHITLEYQTSKEQNVYISMFDISGGGETKILDEMQNEGDHKYDWEIPSNVVSGTYFIQVKGEEGVLSAKVIIQK